MDDKLGRKLEKIRINRVLPEIEGNLLDIGCGNNKLTKAYGSGIGVDVFDWGDVDIIVEDSAKIDLEDRTFETITIIAALNHIPNREQVVEECHRLLKREGKVVVTMIPPMISTVWHFLRRPWDIDQTKRGMQEGEVYGMTTKQVTDLFEKRNFSLVKNNSFMGGINQLYVFRKNKDS